MCVYSRLLRYHITHLAALTSEMEAVSLHPHGTALKLISWLIRDRSFPVYPVVYNIP